MVALAGGFKSDDVVLVDGGPMMGKLVPDMDAGIAKTTSGVLALPADHVLVTMAKKSLSQMVKRSKSACCQCFRCSDLCPRNLIGHEIYPHLTMRTIDYALADTANVTSAFLCSQCGVCEWVGCDIMGLSPRKIFAEYKKALIARGVKNPHHRTKIAARDALVDRKISIPMLMKKIGVTQYDVEMPFIEQVQPVGRVRISLNRHAGAQAIPCVTMGQLVRKCDPIARSPEDGLGTIYHASIEGRVFAVTADYIEIKSHSVGANPRPFALEMAS
jgi:Na+-translocating ferredoxin:NAD+ oxidoreductase RnfC subunit